MAIGHGRILENIYVCFSYETKGTYLQIEEEKNEMKIGLNI